MSPIVILVPQMILASLVLAILIGIRIPKRIPNLQPSILRIFVSLLISITIFSICVYGTIKFASDKYKFGVTPKDVRLKLPQKAYEVDYRWSWVGLREIADFYVSEEEFLSRTEGSAIRRIGHQSWLRNIAVALGNAKTSVAVTDALKSRLQHDSGLVREHVQWALNQHNQ